MKINGKKIICFHYIVYREQEALQPNTVLHRTFYNVQRTYGINCRQQPSIDEERRLLALGDVQQNRLVL